MSIVATDSDVISTSKAASLGPKGVFVPPIGMENMPNYVELATRQQPARDKAIRLVGPFAADKMNTKMKGLLKGLRYISQIFEVKEEEEEEPEMVIGYPTDVKHVAHIGLDGPSTGNTPSWMSGFKNASGPLSPTATARELAGSKPAFQDLQSLMEAEKESVRGSSRAPRHARRPSDGAPLDSPLQDSSHPQKPQRRRHSNSTPSSSANHEASEGSSRPSRRRTTQDSGAVDSSNRDAPGVPRQSRHRRSRGGSSGGSGGGSSTSRASRSKGSLTLTENEPSIASEENHVHEPSIILEENHGNEPSIDSEENQPEGKALFVDIESKD